MPKPLVSAQQAPLFGAEAGEFEKKQPLAHDYQALAAIKNEALGDAGHLDAYDWPQVLQQVDRQGWGLLPGLLDAEQCIVLAAMYDEAAHFRSRIVMQRHAFGVGEYQYFAYPLPPLVNALRRKPYAQLQPLAEHWRSRLQPGGAAWPHLHADLLAQCHAAGQLRPTPLLLRYGTGDYNCLH